MGIKLNHETNCIVSEGVMFKSNTRVGFVWTDKLKWTQWGFTYSKLTKETLEKKMNYVQS